MVLMLVDAGVVVVSLVGGVMPVPFGRLPVPDIMCHEICKATEAGSLATRCDSPATVEADVPPLSGAALIEPAQPRQRGVRTRS